MSFRKVSFDLRLFRLISDGYRSRFRKDRSDFARIRLISDGSMFSLKKIYLPIDILFKWLKILLCTCISLWFGYIYIFNYFSVYFIQNIWANVSQSKLVPFSRCLSDYFKKEVSYHYIKTLFSSLLVCSSPSWVIWSSGARV